MNQSSAPKKLPDKLMVLVNEIEAKAGHPICWKQDKNMGGEMSADVVEGYPTISYRNFTESDAAHELLHLKLTLSGFPRLRCAANMNLTIQAMIMLQGVVQHTVIFPQLRELGYDADESGGIRRQLGGLREENINRIVNEPDLRTLYSMLYVRAKIESKDPDLMAELQSLFTDERLQGCRTLGEKVIKILRMRDLKNHQEAYAALTEAIAVLGRSDIVTIENL